MQSSRFGDFGWPTAARSCNYECLQMVKLQEGAQDVSCLEPACLQCAVRAATPRAQRCYEQLTQRYQKKVFYCRIVSGISCRAILYKQDITHQLAGYQGGRHGKRLRGRDQGALKMYNLRCRHVPCQCVTITGGIVPQCHPPLPPSHALYRDCALFRADGVAIRPNRATKGESFPRLQAQHPISSS
jgi:hypothetical protein